MSKVITQSGSGTTGQTAIDGANVFTTVASALTPSAGNLSFYAKTDGKFYKKDSSGTEDIVGGGLTTALVSGTTTAQAGYHYLANTSSAAFTVTLPAGATGSVIRISDDNRTWGINNLTVAPASGEAIDGQAANATLVCDLTGAFVMFMWDGTKWVFDTNGFGGASGGWATQVIVGATTAQNGYHYLTDTTSSAFTLSLPSGVTGQTIKASDAARTWGVNNLTIAPFSGQKIDGLAINETLVCNANGGWVILTYNGTLWVLDTTAYAAGTIPTYVPQVIGGTLPASGTPGSTNGAAIAAGFVGQVITSGNITGNVGTTNTYFDATSINLSAGIWYINFYGRVSRNGATYSSTEVLLGVSTTPGNSSTGLITVVNMAYDANITSTFPHCEVRNSFFVRCDGTTITIIDNNTAYAAGTTLYLKLYTGIYSAAVPTMNVKLTATRIA